MFSWISKKQPTVALSSTEVEYKAACIAACEAVWLRRILQDIGVLVEDATVLKCDNQSCMAIAKNPMFHARTKHIEILLCTRAHRGWSHRAGVLSHRGQLRRHLHEGSWE